MAEQRSTTDTYQFPTSKEVVVGYSPEVPLSEADLARAAIDQAVSVHEVDTEDIDRRRVESFGASTVAAVETTHPGTPEQYFNPADTAQLIACGQYIVRMRALAAGKQDGFDLAA